MKQRFLMVLILFCVLVIPAAAQERFDAPPYAQRGPYAVGTMELTIEDPTRPLTVTLWYPADAEPGEEPIVGYKVTPLFSLPGHAYRDAAPLAGGGPFPLVVYSHGNNGARVVSLFLTEHLASYGFVVIAADHPLNNIESLISNTTDHIAAYAFRPDDVIRQIDYAADVLNAEGGALAGRIDMARVGITGHSFGGWTALSTAGARTNFDALRAYCADNANSVCTILEIEAEIAAARGYEAPPDGPWDATADPRVGAVVAMAPWNGPILDVSPITAPTMIIVGGGDSVTLPERDAYSFYARMDNPHSMVTLALGDHYIFVDACAPIFVQLNYQTVCTDPVWDMARVHDLINHFATAYLLAHLKEDQAAIDTLASEDATTFPGVIYQHQP